MRYKSLGIMHKLFIIIPVHNRKEITRTCLEMLESQTLTNKDVIVVDDGSTDGTDLMIQSLFPNVTLLHGDGNLWWSGATNLGIAYVMGKTETDDYLLTLNDDTLFDTYYLKRLIESAIEYPNALIGSIAVIQNDESRVIDGGPWINWVTAKIHYANKGEIYREVLKSNKRMEPANLLSGRGMLIPISVLKDIGFINAIALPHYGADYEFSHRAFSKGYLLYVDNSACLTSIENATGLNNDYRVLTWKEIFKSFFSRGSSNCIKYRLQFAMLCCPRYLLPSYIVLDMIRTIIRTFRFKLIRP